VTGHRRLRPDMPAQTHARHSMQDFIKTGLFFLFILGLVSATLAAISAVVVLLVESPLFSTRQIERLAGVGMLFWTGVATCAVTALAFAAIDFSDRRRGESGQGLGTDRE
jgi:hypothetical protein